MIGIAHPRLGGDRSSRVPPSSSPTSAAPGCWKRPCCGLDMPTRGSCRSTRSARSSCLVCAAFSPRSTCLRPRSFPTGSARRPERSDTCSQPSPEASSVTWASPSPSWWPTIATSPRMLSPSSTSLYEPLPSCALVAEALAPGAPRLFRPHGVEQRRRDPDARGRRRYGPGARRPWCSTSDSATRDRREPLWRRAASWPCPPTPAAASCTSSGPPSAFTSTARSWRPSSAFRRARSGSPRSTSAVASGCAVSSIRKTSSCRWRP